MTETSEEKLDLTPSRRPYRCPRLIEYGSLEQRTLGSIAAFDDDFVTGTSAQIIAPPPPPVD